MLPPDGRQPDQDDPASAIPCDDCQAALRSPGRETISFLLVDELTIPLAGCEEHLDQFSSACGLTAQQRSDLLDFLPAGGISCPACRLARHSAEQPVIPVDAGAVGIMACQEHLSEILTRFQTGIQTQHQLTTSLDTS